MIGKLNGTLSDIFEDRIILDVHGVGYIVFVSNRLLSSLPALHETLSLFIETRVREDAIHLFGFMEKIEQDWFCLLQNVPGVGAKCALAILGTLSPNDLAQAIALKDTAMISRAPGVGKKVSERIASELKNKTLPFNKENKNMAYSPSSTPPTDANHHLMNDALSALLNLGFDYDKVVRALATAKQDLQDEPLSSERLIRYSLKLLSQPLSTR